MYRNPLRRWRRQSAMGLVLIISLMGGTGNAPHQVQGDNSPMSMWLVGATLKVPAPVEPSPVWDQPLHLHTGRQEFAPFQIILRTRDAVVQSVQLDVSVDTRYFELTLFHEQYLALPHTPEPEIFTLSRLTEADALPDGLYPVAGPFDVPANATHVIWADLYVQPGTPAGDYTLSVTVAGQDWRIVHELPVTVYPVDVEPLPAMNVLIPLEAEWTVPYFAPGDPVAFHQAVNALLLEHDLIPGTFARYPALTETGWDFSVLDSVLDVLPPGATFHVPSPYNEGEEVYLLRNADGEPYTAAAFDDPVFVAQATAYFDALADYLRERRRLESALVYPVDETRWVGDEPMHAGPEGFRRLAWWTQIAREAGLRVRASGVLPVPPGPPALGWLESEAVADDVHVHLDVLDGAPEAFQLWMQTEGQTASVYLNEYGDLIDLPAVLQRGLIWHVYQYGVRDIAGYAALEWVDEEYGLVDPWQNPGDLSPESGYGGGALVWPGPLPSLRLKLLREGVEDARLLDQYAAQTSRADAEAFAACLTPGLLADQNPAPDLWDRAHQALLVALSSDQPVATDGLCLAPIVYDETRVVLDMDEIGADANEWEFWEVEAAIVEENPSQVLRVTFEGEENEAGFWFGEQDWSSWAALQVDVRNESPYFAELDVAVIDENGSYLLLRDGAVVVGPESSRTLTLPLVEPLDYDDEFDWSTVTYLALHVNTSTEQTDGFGVTRVFPLGERTLTFDNFVLVR
jgi:hypothetical protein